MTMVSFVENHDNHLLRPILAELTQMTRVSASSVTLWTFGADLLDVGLLLLPMSSTGMQRLLMPH